MDAEARIAWHAGLGADLDAPSVSERLAQGDVGPGLDAAAHDLVTAIADLNFQLNGPIPSEGSWPPTDIPRQTAYAVAEVIRMLRGSQAGPSGERWAWRLETAWLAVLAGDIDDVGIHVAYEEAGRTSDR